MSAYDLDRIFPDGALFVGTVLAPLVGGIVGGLIAYWGPEISHSVRHMLVSLHLNARK